MKFAELISENNIKLREVLSLLPVSFYSINIYIFLLDNLCRDNICVFHGLLDVSDDIPDCIFSYLDYPVSLSYYFGGEFIISLRPEESY